MERKSLCQGPIGPESPSIISQQHQTPTSFKPTNSICTLRSAGSLSQSYKWTGVCHSPPWFLVKSEQEMDQWCLSTAHWFSPLSVTKDRKGGLGDWDSRGLVTLKCLSPKLPSDPLLPARPTAQGPHFLPKGIMWYQECSNT